MKKEHDSIQEIYNFEFLLSKELELLQDYESDPHNQIESLLECSNIQFISALEITGRILFSGFSLLTDPLLLALASMVYSSIVNRYSKTASLESFAEFVQIDPETVRSWQADSLTLKKGQGLTDLINETIYIYNILYFSNKPLNYYNSIGKNNIIYPSYNILDAERVKKELSTKIFGVVYNRIVHNREVAIKYKMIDSKQQVGAIAVANSEYGWSADRIGQEERARALTLADLPKLTNYVNKEEPPKIEKL